MEKIIVAVIWTITLVIYCAFSFGPSARNSNDSFGTILAAAMFLSITAAAVSILNS